MLALVDADIILYRTGYASENDSETIALVRADTTVKDILDATEATEYQLWLSDSLENNYRSKIDANYKSSRKKQPKPKHYAAIKKFLQYEWGAQITEGQEADDELGIRQSIETICGSGTGSGKGVCSPQSVICSIDKDLKQVAGLHYNFVKREFDFVDSLSGLRSFYSQFLIGDRVDDIEGIRGIGPVGTAAILKNCNHETDFFQQVRQRYQDDERLLKNGRLLWVRREPNQMWEFPIEQEQPPVQDLCDEEGFTCHSDDGHSEGETPFTGDVL